MGKNLTNHEVVNEQIFRLMTNAKKRLMKRELFARRNAMLQVPCWWLGLLAICLALAVGAQDFESVKRAAESGDAQAQFRLGAMYDRGDGVVQNYSEAVKWYRQAAEQGNADAQFKLGGMYGGGAGVVQSHTEAVKWWRKAAEQGNADAQFNLGMMYYGGYGVVQSHTEAVNWWRKAGEQGNEDAKAALKAMGK